MNGTVLALSKIIYSKLNYSNYFEWSRKIRVYLRSVDKDDHHFQDPPNDDAKMVWLIDDARLSCKLDTFMKELMDYFEYLYSRKGNLSQIYDICKAFYCSKKVGKLVTTLLHGVQENL
ncbi:hypothetical protein R3W88_016438 [Solanum pinnatisectum]|uniref:Retrotransposon Copia-like N-terminal domain-containing protein n=1 Tax=Solanum pinnatisectum TaxID=50273 RepID=A0AAV9L0H5_9SOLN|nr:hypothetical protein R3W88_016438 [Solanum pinnatisectum]